MNTHYPLPVADGFGLEASHVVGQRIAITNGNSRADCHAARPYEIIHRCFLPNGCLTLEAMSQFKHCAHSEIAGFAPLLRGWIECQKEYAKQTRDDYAWRYHERACIGFLAAAAWRIGGIALEEWRTEKAQECRGRGDLWISHRTHRFHIEAKHCFTSAIDPRGIERARNILEKSVRAARHLRCNEAKLAVLFVSPIFRGQEKERISKNVLAHWMQEIEKIKHHAIAWIFEKSCEKPPGADPNFVPGIVLLARQVGGRRRIARVKSASKRR